MTSAQKTFSYKAKLHKRYVVELNIFQFSDKKKYPDNIKYRLICIDIKTGKKVLFDNHIPKGHHFHINETEFKYDFVNEDQLIEDFQKLIYDHFGVRL